MNWNGDRWSATGGGNRTKKTSPLVDQPDVRRGSGRRDHAWRNVVDNGRRGRAWHGVGCRGAGAAHGAASMPGSGATRGAASTSGAKVAEETPEEPAGTIYGDG